ncbi:MAG: carbamate kinase [Chloroflexi bacterium]|nr:carbamate kinase [Chloroflexota bacterium]
MASKTAVVAIGGNSLILDKNRPDVGHQWQAVHETCQHIAAMIEEGWSVVVTHGNGPQVGFILRRNELAAHEVHTTPLDLIGADTQGAIGYMLQQGLSNALHTRNIQRGVVTVITQVLVNKDDPGFQNPTKPIGGFLEEATARKFEADGWQVVEDAGRGWRRVIASPQPLEIVELDAIQRMIQDGFIVIACGGGGIPVIRTDAGEIKGAPPSVIDKDRASSLLASHMKADLFLISTGVEQVAIRFNTPQQQNLDRITVAQAKEYMAAGEFAEGSMKPKIQAAIRFLERGGQQGQQALITDPPNILRALRGETGTWILPD